MTTYLQQRQALKLKAPTNLTPRNIPRNREKSCNSTGQKGKKAENGLKADKKSPVKLPDKNKKPKKRIKNRTKKQAKVMRKLGKINKELLQDGTLPCEIRSPVCTYFATVVNHNAGRVGDQALKKEDMTRCCPPCNDYIESHHEWARERGFKVRRHGPKNKS